MTYQTDSGGQRVKRSSSQPYRVLIADDDAATRWALSTVLRNEGFEPLEAEHGNAALQILRDEWVDVLLLDLVMPGMNGLDVLRAVRQRDAELPVILVTGHGTEDVAMQAGVHAAEGILTKPFRNDEVALGVRVALARRRLAKRKASAPRPRRRPLQAVN